MLVQFVCNYYRNELGNPGKKQVGMKRFLILGFTSGNTKTVFEMVDGFLNIPSDFVGGIPFIRTADCTRVGTQIFLRIKINHPAAGSFLIIYPFHFGAYELYGRESAAQMRFTAFPFHRQGMPVSFKGLSVSGREILPLSGIYQSEKSNPYPFPYAE